MDSTSDAPLEPNSALQDVAAARPGAEASEALRARLQAQKRRLETLREVVAAQQARLHRLQNEPQPKPAVFESALPSLFIVDAQGRVQAANSAFTSVADHVFVRPPSAGDTLDEVVRPAERAAFRSYVQQARQGETVTTTERFLVGGAPHWFQFVFTPLSQQPLPPSASAPTGTGRSPTVPLPAGDGTVSAEAVLLQSINVTQQKLAEEALRVREARRRSLLRKALDTTSAGLMILAGDGRIVWINQALERFFGIDRPSVLGRDRQAVLREEIAPRLDSPEPFIEQIVDAHESGARIEGLTCRVRRDDASARFLEYQSRPIDTGLYAGGRVEHYYDVTERKETEAALRETRDAAETAQKDLSRFLATVSHEIRTSMTGIQGFADLLLDKDVDAETRHFAEVISEGGDAVLSLLNDVLDLSRLEAGAVDLEPHPFDLADSLQSALDTVRAPAQQKTLQLKLHVSGDLPETVVGDEMRIRQVLVNLLSNAVKFTDTGHIRLHADRLADGDRPPGTDGLDDNLDGKDEGEIETPILLHLRVADTGVGISEGEQDHLFEAFHQAAPSTSREHGGSGLGLAIVQQLVDAMGGTIALDSEPGVGSCFHVVLPVGRAE